MAKERKKKKATKKASKKKTTKKKAPKKTTKRKSTKKKTTRKKTAKKRTTKKKTTKRKTTKRKASKKKTTKKSTPPGILEADQAIAIVEEPPEPKMSPGKIVAFAGAGVLLAGGMYMLVRLMTNGSGGTTAGPTMTSPMAVNGFGYYPNYYNY